jgi:hypothetical protein
MKNLAALEHDRVGVCFPRKERHPRFLAASIQAESLVSVKQKPRPTWERGPGLSWLTAKLVGQKATPGGGHDHREAKAASAVMARLGGGAVSVGVTPTSLVPYLRRPRTHQARLRPRKM